ncbi:hypothetical protein A4F89_03005 [Polynucleobacter asymbioticus]|nr:hypothetical protein A4F89_03005 [Polynucleobacter asymbioticus]
MYGDPQIAHHILRAIPPSIETFLRGIILADVSGPFALGLLYGLVMKALYIYGATLIFINTSDNFKFEINQKFSIFLAAAFLFSAYLIVLAGYYQYGLSCCERHSTFKDCLIFLALICISASIASIFTSKKIISKTPLVQLGSAFIFISILIGVFGSYQNISKAYNGFASKKEMIHANWERGLTSDKAMIFEQRDDPIVGGILRPPGTYVMGNDVDWGAAAIMRFFSKESITFTSD